MPKTSLIPPVWREYFRELLIVVIGILIAFALNNWAQNQSNKALLSDYMENLRLDLATDTLKMTENMAVFQRNIAAFQSLIPHFYRELPGRDTVVARFFRGSSFPVFSTQDATYKTLLNTGDLKLIRSFDLKKEILDHYGKYDILFQENHRTETFIREYYAGYFMNQVDQSALFRTGDDKPLDDPKFRNLVFSLTGIAQIQMKRYEEALERTRKLLRMLA